MTNPSRTTLCQVLFLFFLQQLLRTKPDDTDIKQPSKYPIPGRQERKGSYSSAIMGNKKNLGMRLSSFF